MTARPARAVVALGSNLGDRLLRLREARRALDALPGVRVRAASWLYETAPVGGPPQGDFLNACLALETTASPEALLARLHALETEAGRRRDVVDGPRTLDLDLILFDDVVRDGPPPTLPHPRFARRAFVLAPLRDLAGEAPSPPDGRTPDALWAALTAAERAAVRRLLPPEEWS
ncbi:MAG TPA: 2-amino-4-hydroxy-6-hydroxymethyldihydropteridine diphosphokinase [Planctomycetota bacterium]|nr:2-amino-4-hydroxy-6-hydroxymethyldihydropteridine diphosphokinase [Planctomycetota bacterium]